MALFIYSVPGNGVGKPDQGYAGPVMAAVRSGWIPAPSLWERALSHDADGQERLPRALPRAVAQRILVSRGGVAGQ